MLGKVWRNPETGRCYNELQQRDCTMKLFRQYAQECFTVERRGEELYLKPDIYAFALKVEMLLDDIFDWEKLTESAYNMLRRIGDFRNIDFHEIAEYYFEHDFNIRVTDDLIAEVA